MRYLAVPWVWECAWRSVFPALYLQRYAWYDSPLNSILVDRCVACVGELCWTLQIAIALRRQGDGRFVALASVFAVVTYVVAEGASFYNVATTNEWWAAAEVGLDGVAVLPLAPAALSLLWRGAGSRGSAAFLWVLVLGVAAQCYFNFFVDVPMYLARYEADEAAGKAYFAFVPGLEDAWKTRVVARTYAAWGADMFWMTAYFTLACWSGLLLMLAPKPESDLFPKKDARVQPLLPPESA